jgi:hypothetical protein
MPALLALPLILYQVVRFARGPIKTLIIKPMTLRAKVAVLFLIIAKMTLAEGTFALVQRLPL